jgi:hypothetical protein
MTSANQNKSFVNDDFTKYLTLGENELTAVYTAKATSNKYVVAVAKAFVGMTSQELIILAEANKKCDLRGTQSDSFKKKQKKFDPNGQFAASKPTTSLQQAIDTINAIVTRNGCSLIEKHSWGAFVQNFEKQLEPLVTANLYIIPRAESFHYSRTMYMMMSMAQALKYFQWRNYVSMQVVTAVHNAIPDVLTMEMTRKQMGVALKGYDLLAAMKLQPYTTTMPHVKDVTIIAADAKTIERHTQIMGAYPIDYRYYLQNKGFRTDQGTREDFNKCVSHITSVLAIFNIEAPTGTINLMEAEAQWRKDYFAVMKHVKALCGIVRAFYKSGEKGLSGQQAKRDYAHYVADFGGAPSPAKAETTVPAKKTKGPATTPKNQKAANSMEV